MRCVTLLIPGLLPVPEGAELPPKSRLRTTLSRADHVSAPVDYQGLLAGQFELKPPLTGDWPAAAFSYLADIGQTPATVCMRIDPVHLATGREGLVLLDSNLFEMTGEEAAALAAAIQPLLADHATVIETPRPTRWYLQMQAVPDIQTTPLFDVAGRDIGPYLPRGGGRRDWHRLLNEIQMTLHEHPVNRVREDRGVLAINSVWFWGIGTLPLIGQSRAGIVFADEPIARGLARAHGMTLQALPAGADECLQKHSLDEDGIVVIDSGWRFNQYHDAGGWLDFIDWLERDWMVPLLTAIRQGHTQSLSILMPGQGYHLKRRHLWRFWRRPKK
jgi:hypothetical protein